MNTPNTGDRAQHPATVSATYHPAIAAQDQVIKLVEDCILFLFDQDNWSPVGCSVVIEEAEKLIDAVQTLKQALKDRASVQGGAQ